MKDLKFGNTSKANEPLRCKCRSFAGSTVLRYKPACSPHDSEIAHQPSFAAMRAVSATLACAAHLVMVSVNLLSTYEKQVSVMRVL